MQPIRRAVIDVGTNSVKLLVADVAGREVVPIREESQQTRLGHRFYESGRLQAEAIAATANAAAAFAATARQCRATSMRVIATSAAREAVNAAELKAAIEQASGLKLELISGDQEAMWGFQGVTTDAPFADVPLMLLDVGGGSTQITSGRGGQVAFEASYPIGSVRLLEQRPPSDPPKPEELAECSQRLRQFFHEEVRPGLRAARAGATPTSEDVQLVGVGGTASILGCMEAKLESFDRARLEATRLSAASIGWHLERLWSLPLADRRQIPGLPMNRADVILMGTAIYHACMEEFAFAELRISTRGLRFAALMD